MDLLAQRGIQAGTSLLNKSEVKRCDIGNRLNIRQFKVRVVSGNPWDISQGNRLPERSSKIRVCRAVVPGKPARVYGEVHEIREPPNVLGPVCRAARQSAEFVQVHG